MASEDFSLNGHFKIFPKGEEAFASNFSTVPMLSYESEVIEDELSRFGIKVIEIKKLDKKLEFYDSIMEEFKAYDTIIHIDQFGTKAICFKSNFAGNMPDCFEYERKANTLKLKIQYLGHVLTLVKL